MLHLRCRKQIHESWGKLAEFLSNWTNPPDAIFDFEASIAPEVDVLLGSIRVSPRRISDMTEQPKLVALLEARLKEKQDQMRENLEKVNWEIDTEATLRAVAGDALIETVSHHQYCARGSTI